MEEIKNFITGFIESEYRTYKTDYDFIISDDAYEKLREDTVQYFHTVVGQHYWRGLNEDDVKLLDEEMKKLYSENSKRAIKRTLFQIRHYIDPKLGDSLAMCVTGNDLYACYVSYPGKLIAVEKYQAPEEETSLKDYNS